MCDCEPPTLFESRTIKGRKAHRCCECLGVIDAGALYVRSKGLWDGYWSTYSQCVRCSDFMYEVAKATECGVPFSCLKDYLDRRDSELNADWLDERRENYKRIKARKAIATPHSI